MPNENPSEGQPEGQKKPEQKSRDLTADETKNMLVGILTKKPQIIDEIRHRLENDKIVP